MNMRCILSSNEPLTNYVFIFNLNSNIFLVNRFLDCQLMFDVLNL